MPKNRQQRYRRPGPGLVFENTPQTRSAPVRSSEGAERGRFIGRGRFQNQARSRPEGPQALQVLDTHCAHGVQDSDDRHAHVAKDGKPHIGDAQRCQHKDQQLNAQRKDDVLPNN